MIRIDVRLSWHELALAGIVATQRIIYNLQKGAKGRQGAPATGAEADRLNIMSCPAELAAAKALNLYWSGAVGDYSAPDVGGFVDVRSIGEANHSLILHEWDEDTRPFILVHCQPPRFSLLGWAYAAEGKQDAYWREDVRGPAWFAPQAILRPMSELKALPGLWEPGL